MKAEKRISDKRLITLFTMLLLVAGMSTDIYIPSLPLMTKAFNTNPAYSSFTISIFMIASAVSGLVAAVISDRYGRRKILLYSSMAYIISTFAVAFSPNILTMIILRAIQGATCGFTFIVTRQVIKDLYTVKQQISINSILFTAFVISPAIAPILGSMLAKFFSWHACFIFTALFQIVLYYQLKKHFNETIPNTKPIPHPITYLGSFSTFFMTKDFNACVLISSFSFAGYFCFLTISSFIFITTFGFSSISYSCIFIFLASVYMLGNFLMKYFNERDMAKPVIIFYGCFFNLLGSLLLFFSYINISTTLSILALIVGAIIMRFGLGFMLALVQIMAMNRFKKNGGHALGALNFIQCSLASLAAVWASHFADHITGIFVVSLIFNAGAMLAHKILFDSQLRFPNLKYKFLKKMFLHDATRKYLELKLNHDPLKIKKRRKR
jgi:MFS transporter, DHA1 family, multidrug resistance protein